MMCGAGHSSAGERSATMPRPTIGWRAPVSGNEASVPPTFPTRPLESVPDAFARVRPAPPRAGVFRVGRHGADRLLRTVRRHGRRAVLESRARRVGLPGGDGRWHGHDGVRRSAGRSAAEHQYRPGPVRPLSHRERGERSVHRGPGGECRQRHPAGAIGLRCHAAPAILRYRRDDDRAVPTAQPGHTEVRRHSRRIGRRPRHRAAVGGQRQRRAAIPPAADRHQRPVPRRQRQQRKVPGHHRRVHRGGRRT